ncbi:MAG: response regulator transcription factor [Gammaproteobacteria bacterium]|nr:response regulator transcription factor [Gammaproteobacteria bacterium]
MNEKFKILVVEDEQAILTGLIDVLVFHGYEVDAASEGNEGLRKAMTGQFDLVLLDVMLPGINGFEICNAIREQDKQQAIIMLTAKGTDDDIVQGLQFGADDYVTKPFSVAQLVLRIQAVLRRSSVAIQNQSRIDLGSDTWIDTANLSGGRNGEVLAFTRREIEVLQYLASHHERPVSRDELLNKVWGYDRGVDIETRTVDIHIAKIRRKIELDHKAPELLITVRSAGYRLLISGPDGI